MKWMNNSVLKEINLHYVTKIFNGIDIFSVSVNIQFQTNYILKIFCQITFVSFFVWQSSTVVLLAKSLRLKLFPRKWVQVCLNCYAIIFQTSRCRKRQSMYARKAILQFKKNVIVNPIKNGRLSKLDSWLPLTSCHFERDRYREISK